MNEETANITIHKTADTYWLNVEFYGELMFCHRADDWDQVIREIRRLGPFLYNAPKPPQPMPSKD